jgi:GT2 family glycosyltransferase
MHPHGAANGARGFSVIIPVFNGAAHLESALEALTSSTLPPSECIVVDDGSTDGSGLVARRFGYRVIATGSRGGPAHARNLGASAAKGDILVFVDADVCVHPDALERMLRRLDEDPRLCAVFGSYDTSPSDQRYISQFRNLLHCYTHQTGNEQASTFWGACGAIRTDCFNNIGGFRTHYVRPSIEDIDLGCRIRAAGGRIALDRNVLATHKKRWDLWSTVRTDVADRAAPWAKLILETRKLPDDLNLRKTRRASLFAVWTAVVLLIIGMIAGHPGIALATSLACVLVSAMFDLEFYRFLAKLRGLPFALRAVPLYSLFHLYSGIGFMAGACSYAWDIMRGRETAPLTGVQTVDLESQNARDLRTQLD